MVKLLRTWQEWKKLKLEKGPRLHGISLAKIHSERKDLRVRGKPSDHDFRYEWWRDAHAFYSEYMDTIQQSTGFYYEIVDGERPCHFYLTFPASTIATLEWLESTFTQQLRAAFTESLPRTTPFAPKTDPLFWSDGSVIYVYWHDIVFESPSMCGLFVQMELQGRFDPHGITFDLNVYPTSTDDWGVPTKVRFPYSGKRLLGKAHDCSRPLRDHGTREECVRRSTITVLQRPREGDGVLEVVCLCDEADNAVFLLPSDQIAYFCSFSRTAGSSLDTTV